MRNLYKQSLHGDYRKLECDGLLFVEYKCVPDENEMDSLWSPYGHLVYVTAGNKTWITPDGEFPAAKGEAIYCKKGACIMRHFYESNFCALIFFFPKDFICEVVNEYQVSGKSCEESDHLDFHILKMNMDDSLKLFFESVSGYFFQKSAPSKHLVKLKFKELILQVLTTDENPILKAYFLLAMKENREGIESVVRKNLFHNLSIEDYARLCGRSLSSFKRDFKKHFGVAPLQWILEERLTYGRMRLLTTEESINDVAFRSGFESPEHFIRCFKRKFGQPPLRYRLELQEA